MTRIGISTRAFGLAAALGLAASDRVVPQVAGAFLLLCAIAALACVPQPTEAAQQVVPIVEGALVGLALASGGLVSEPLGLYLLVPVLLAGLTGGAPFASLTLIAELATMSAVVVVSEPAGMIPTRVSDVLPWLLTGVGIGLLGAYFRRARFGSVDTDSAGYAVAHRLLDSLRVVSRRLSSGLDAERLAATLLRDCLTIVGGGAGAVLVRDEDGGFRALTELAGGPVDLTRDPLVERCWEARTTTIAHGWTVDPDPHSRCALPILEGDRMVGVLVLDGPRLDQRAFSRLQPVLDERALRLEAALLFDEIRTHATVEERRRLAREIHDGVAQEIASLGYLVDDLTIVPEEFRIERVARLRGELTRIVEDLRLSIFDLRSQVSRTTGLGAVLADYLRQIDLRSDITVHLSLDESTVRLPLDVEEQLLRIAQEAVTNARKHSRAANLWVSCIVRAPAATVVVEDDGIGVSSPLPPHGFGMSIMRERAQRVGATLTVLPRENGGTRVGASISSANGTLATLHAESRAIDHTVAITRKKAVSHV